MTLFVETAPTQHVAFTIAGACMLATGVFLPWASIDAIWVDIPGLHTGPFGLGVLAISLPLAVAGALRRWTLVWTLALGALILVLGFAFSYALVGGLRSGGLGLGVLVSLIGAVISVFSGRRAVQAERARDTVPVGPGTAG